MEFVLQALTYPEIGEIIYTSAQGDTQKAISDFRGLISQGVDVIVTFPDAGEALLPTAREATAQGIQVVPYIASLGGEAGTDYLTFVAEDLCQLGVNFADVLNTEVGSGKVAFLGGTPGNPLSEAWQSCEEPELAPELELVGTADTSWTQEGTLQAVSGLLAEHPDLAGISYEYADGFLGGIRATRPQVCLSTSCSPCGPMKWDCSANGPPSPIPISRSTSRRAEALTRGSP